MATEGFEGSARAREENALLFGSPGPGLARGGPSVDTFGQLSGRPAIGVRRPRNPYLTLKSKVRETGLLVPDERRLALPLWRAQLDAGGLRHLAQRRLEILGEA